MAQRYKIPIKMCGFRC